MLDNRQPIEVGWYDFEHCLAAVANGHAFVLAHIGWHKVREASVTRDGVKFPNAEAAIDAFGTIWHGIDPSVVAIHIARGMAPPRPKQYRRYVLIEEAAVLDGRDDFTGCILVEFDDGTMRKIDGKELANLSRSFPRLGKWRLSGRENYWWL